MVAHREVDNLEKVFEGQDRVFLCVLLDLLKRPDIKRLKTQHDNTIALRKVTEALNLTGLKQLLSIQDSPVDFAKISQCVDFFGNPMRKDSESAAELEISPFSPEKLDENQSEKIIESSRVMPKMSPRHEFSPKGDLPVD